MPCYKITKNDYTRSKEWLDKAKEYVKSFNSTCWCCNAHDSIDVTCQVYHKVPETQTRETKDDLVCLCSDCFKSVNRIMFVESDFIIMMNYLKQKMYKNDWNRIFTYSQVKDFKEEYLQEQIKIFKQTLDPSLQFELIHKVLTLPVN